MPDCEGCGVSYASDFAAASCEDQHAAEDAGTRRAARSASRRLRAQRPSWPGEDDGE